MLSERLKAVLSGGVQQMARVGLMTEMQIIGPKHLLDLLLEVAQEEGQESVSRSVRENREEAERYLAGLLGMM